VILNLWFQGGKMKKHDFLREPEFEHNNLRITKGVEASKLGQGNNMLMQVYTLEAAVIKRRGQEMIVPPRSVFKVRPETKYEFVPSVENQTVYAFEMLNLPVLPEHAELEKIMGNVDRSEINNLVYTSEDQKISIFPRYSRILPFKPSVESGWYTHAKKGTLLAVADRFMSELREGEVLHHHTTIEEMWITLEGASNLKIGDEQYKVAQGNFIMVQPSTADSHKIETIDTDPKTNNYGHICLNWPSMPGDNTERIVLEEKKNIETFTK